MKKWFLERFLPMWAKETVFADNRALLRQNKKLQQKVALLESYIEGMQAGLRLGKKVSVYSGGKG